MKRRSVAIFLATSALLSTVVGATLSIYHNGTSCSVYQDGVLIYFNQCNAGQIAHCDYSNGQITMYCEDPAK